MKSITQRAYARAGLLGNPSDGYHGKTISLIVRNWHAEVSLSESDQLEIVPGAGDRLAFHSLADAARQFETHGFYGGVRLLKAALNRFYTYTCRAGLQIDAPNFTITYRSTIPRQVGLSGSSAIAIAALRSLASWFGVTLEPHLLAALATAAEHDLGIPAGPQDRVIQAFEGLVYMNFDESVMKSEQGLEFGAYRQLDPALLPTLYLAYSEMESEPTEIVHNDLRTRFDKGDTQVVAAMQRFAELAEEGLSSLEARDTQRLGALINENFDLRDRICKLREHHRQMIHTARGSGASAKYCGSGGAIIGIYDGDSMWTQLAAALSRIGCQVIKPQIL